MLKILVFILHALQICSYKLFKKHRKQTKLKQRTNQQFKLKKTLANKALQNINILDVKQSS